MTTPLLRSTDATCDDLGIKRTTLYKLIKAEKLDAKKQGHRTYITTASIQRYIASLPGISDGNAGTVPYEPFGKPRVPAEENSATRS
jgi:hypothetical protein